MHRRRGFIRISEWLGFAGRASQCAKSPFRHVIHVSSLDVSKLGSVIVLDLADEDEAMKVLAQKLARETGRRVTVRDATLGLIKTIPAARVH
jgi:hypothetical protein